MNWRGRRASNPAAISAWRLHAIADPDSKIQNLARGQTYVSLTDGKKISPAREHQRGARRL